MNDTQLMSPPGGVRPTDTGYEAYRYVMAVKRITIAERPTMQEACRIYDEWVAQLLSSESTGTAT
jgi:hypothetical protein